MLFHTKNEAGLQDRLTTVEMINNKNTSSTKKNNAFRKLHKCVTQNNNKKKSHMQQKSFLIQIFIKNKQRKVAYNLLYCFCVK